MTNQPKTIPLAQALKNVPLPVKQNPKNHYEVYDGQKLRVCGCPYKQQAAVLVHAVNNLEPLVEALQLTHNFYNRFFVRESLEDFRKAGYTGTDDGNEMKDWLWNKREAALQAALNVEVPQ